MFTLTDSTKSTVKSYGFSKRHIKKCWKFFIDNFDLHYDIADDGLYYVTCNHYVYSNYGVANRLANVVFMDAMLAHSDDRAEYGNSVIFHPVFEYGDKRSVKLFSEYVEANCVS